MDEYSTVCFLLIGGPKQNVVSLLTLISDAVFMLFHTKALVMLSTVAFSTFF